MVVLGRVLNIFHTSIQCIVPSQVLVDQFGVQFDAHVAALRILVDFVSSEPIYLLIGTAISLLLPAHISFRIRLRSCAGHISVARLLPYW